MEYVLIEIFTSEAAQYAHAPVYHAVVQSVRSRRMAARVHVYRGTCGAYESGEFSTVNILDLSANLPVKIEILLPATEVAQILPLLAEIVTEGAIAVRPLDVRHHKSESRLLPRDLRVADIMTPNPVTVTPEASVVEVVRILMAHSFRGLPVVDASGHLVGIITDEDLIVRARLPVRPGLLTRLGADKASLDPEFSHLVGMQVRDAMTTSVDTVAGTAFVHQAVEKMVRQRRRTLPVVDATGRVVGMCSRLDVLMAAGHWHRSLKGWEGTSMSLSGGGLVRDAVGDRERRVTPDTSLLDVAALITQGGARRVAVVDAGERLVGIVAEADLLRALEPEREGLWAYLVHRLSRAQVRQRFPSLTDRVQAQTAAAVMTPGPVVVSDCETLGNAANLMAGHGFKELPVVDEQGRFIGFLSRMDLLRAIAELDLPQGPANA